MRASLIKGGESLLVQTQQNARIIFGGLSKQLVAANSNVIDIRDADRIRSFPCGALPQLSRRRREGSDEKGYGSQRHELRKFSSGDVALLVGCDREVLLPRFRHTVLPRPKCV